MAWKSLELSLHRRLCYSWSEEHVLDRTQALQKLKKLDAQIRNRFEDDWKTQWDDYRRQHSLDPSTPNGDAPPLVQMVHRWSDEI